MNSNGTTFTYTPFWLHALSQEERDEVVTWLKDAGMNVELCPGFDFDGQMITTRYYALNDQGSPYMDKDMDPVYEGYVREFRVKSAPPVVKEAMKHA